MPPLNEEEATTVGGGGRRVSESELGPEAMVSQSLSLSLSLSLSFSPAANYKIEKKFLN